jgi:hypothetical protein
MIPESEAVDGAKFWAMQTYVFAMNVRNPNAPTEVLEQITIKANKLAAQFLAEAEAECGENPKSGDLMVALVKRVLDWVVEYHGRK